MVKKMRKMTGRLVDLVTGKRFFDNGGLGAGLEHARPCLNKHNWFAVGAAIADYLSTGRPRCSIRRVFIRAKAPLTGFANSVAICSLVDRAMERAGVESEYRGSHVFRHYAACGIAATRLRWNFCKPASTGP